MSGRWRKALALLLFVVSCYLFSGCFIYARMLLALLFFFSSRVDRRRELAVGAVCLVFFTAAFLFFYQATEPWRVRIGQELGSIAIGFTRRGLSSAATPSRGSS